MIEEESGHWYGFVLVCLPTHKLHGASMFQAISGRCVLFQFKRVVYLIFHRTRSYFTQGRGVSTVDIILITVPQCMIRVILLRNKEEMLLIYRWNKMTA